MRQRDGQPLSGPASLRYEEAVPVVTTRPRWPAIAAVAADAALLSFASRAGASPTARLVYVRGDGADACPDEASLKHAVATRLGYDPFRPFVPITLFVEVHREAGQFVGSVKVVDENATEQMPAARRPGTSLRDRSAPSLLTGPPR
jgi:hypothetical protein